jgi:autotransporter-associated beta strand protein
MRRSSGFLSIIRSQFSSHRHRAQRIVSVVASFAFFAICGNAHGGTMLDQEQLIYNGGTSARTLPGYSVWQSFTAGITGTLSEIDMGFFDPMQGDGTLRIYGGEGTGGTLYETVTVPVVGIGNGPLTWNDWSVSVPIIAGQQYTFDLTPNPLTLPDPYGVCNGPNSYPGDVFGFSDPSGQYPTTSDAVFRTYVTTVPKAALWTSAVSGSWSDSTKWTGGVVPNAVGAGAVFSASTTTTLIVTLDGPQTIGTLVLGSGTPGVGYTLSGSGSNTLTLNNSGGGATITVIDGNHVINAPVVLADNLVVTTGGTNAWTFAFRNASSITDNGGGYSLTMNGTGGKLILTGSDSYGGGTTVSAGALIATSATALPDGTSLTIGAGATFIFDPTTAAIPMVKRSSPLLAASPAAAVAAVPEPGTFALLAAGLVVGFGVWRGRRGIRD